MAEEEQKHEETLKLHYSSLVSSGKLAALGKLGQAEDHTGEIIKDKVRKEIKAAGYEAAAIASAIALEKEAERSTWKSATALNPPLRKSSSTGLQPGSMATWSSWHPWTGH